MQKTRRPGSAVLGILLAASVLLTPLLGVPGMYPSNVMKTLFRSSAATLSAPDLSVRIHNTHAVLTWKPVAGANRYEILRRTGLSAPDRVIARVKAPDSTQGRSAGSYVLTYKDVFHDSFTADNEQKLFRITASNQIPWYVDPVKNPMVYSVRALTVDENGKTVSQGTARQVVELQTPAVMSVKLQGQEATITWKTVANAEDYVISVGKNNNGSRQWKGVKRVKAAEGETMTVTVPRESGYSYYTVAAQCSDARVRSGSESDFRTDQRNKTGEQILFLGDSLVYGEPYTGDVGGYGCSYPYRVAQLTGATIYNAGISGATIADHDSKTWSILRDETDFIAQGKTPHKPKASKMPENKKKLSDFSTIVLEGGANDYSKSVPLGPFGGTDETTFYGGYRAILKQIDAASAERIRKGKSPIKVVFTGMFYSSKNNKDPIHPNSKFTRKNSKGLTYTDYQKAVEREYKAWADNKSASIRVYYYDPMKVGDLTAENCSYTTVDDLHMSACLYSRIGNSLTAFLRQEVWK
ncbi:MAG: SGNH/GDSL hydrolase family protein [Clostridia bacterium]|nr:SGNH/GDSL hydrolase family protein [Clostridia bacterium]